MTQNNLSTAALADNRITITIPHLPSAADFADAVAEQYQGQPVDGPVHVSVRCFFTPPKFPTKAQRGNADDLLLRTLRTFEGILWPNDGQVMSAMMETAWGAEEKTVVRVHPVDLAAELPKDF